MSPALSRTTTKRCWAALLPRKPSVFRSNPVFIYPPTSATPEISVRKKSGHKQSG
jgi:hypothetical protein